MKKFILIILALLILAFPIFFQIKKNNQPPYKNSSSKTTEQKKHVFLIIMENTDWKNIKGNLKSAPYINSLLSRTDSSFANQYFNPPSIHPSEPNYVWLEAGDSKNLPNGLMLMNFTTDSDPGRLNSTSTKNHITAYLNEKSIPWKIYAEGIDGISCPLENKSETKYAVRHIPVLFFQDITDNNSADSRNCIKHVRPLTELTADLNNQTIPNYSVLIPNTCNDMHDFIGCKNSDRIKNGDEWLSNTLPEILNSEIYKKSGIVFLTWDEGENKKDGPIGLIILSPFSKGNGYNNSVHYDHSSLLKTILQIFDIRSFPRHTLTAKNLMDFFKNQK